MIDYRKFEVISFDCYGTLIDWETGILDALRSILATHDLFPPDDTLLSHYAEAESAAESGGYLRYREVLRRAMGSVLSRLGVGSSEEEVDLLARSIKDWAPFPDTVAALRTLEGRYRLAVISNVDDDIFAVTARRLQTEFDWVVTAEEARCYKPDPRIFALASAKIGVPKDKHLHAAQSLYHDVAPAKALGLTTVWVNRRRDRAGPGATPPSQAVPHAEVPDLLTLADLVSRS